MAGLRGRLEWLEQARAGGDCPACEMPPGPGGTLILDDDAPPGWLGPGEFGPCLACGRSLKVYDAAVWDAV